MRIIYLGETGDTITRDETISTSVMTLHSSQVPKGF